MKMWIEVDGDWVTRDEAADNISYHLRRTKATSFIIEEAEQHARDVAQGYIEFRVYTRDDASPEDVLEAADHLQDVFIDETACEEVCTQDVTYEVFPRKVTN